MGQIPEDGLFLAAGGRNLSVPMTAEYIDVAITLLSALKRELLDDNAIATPTRGAEPAYDDDDDQDRDDSARAVGTVPADVAQLELGSIEQLDLSGEAQG